jgi:2-amino-4-hydroxy-6-hydroxymethyldihydropteridine diphosphokinase
VPLKQVFLALGSNLGDRARNLARAMDALEAEGIHILARSSLYETEPRDFTDQPYFLNMVVQAETRLFPRQLLAITQQIERKLGRVRAGVPRGGPRLIDIDILLFGRICIST